MYTVLLQIICSKILPAYPCRVFTMKQNNRLTLFGKGNITVVILFQLLFVHAFFFLSDKVGDIRLLREVTHLCTHLSTHAKYNILLV